MTISRRGAFRALLITALPMLLSMAPASHAQEVFPSRTLRLVVPFAAGGPTDVMARILAENVSARLGQTMIVENRGGGGGTIGVDAVAKAKPDGYTLAVIGGTSVNAFHFLNRSNFDFKKEFESIGQVYVTPSFIMINPAAQGMKDINTLQQLIAYSKTVPQVAVTGAGLGSTAHLLMAQLARITGARFVYVPYKGAGPALNDVLAGVVPVYIGTMTQASLVRSGKLRGLAFTNEKREAAMPEIPTLAESGIADLVARTPVGLAVTGGTPPAIVNRLVAEFRAAITDPGVVAKLAAAGINTGYLPPDQFGDIIMRDFKFWGQVIRDNNIKAE